MLKFMHKISFVEYRAFWAHDFTEEMDTGFRLSFDLDSVLLGGSIIWEDFEHDNNKLHYEFDATYNLLDLFELSAQTSIVDDSDDSSNDLLVFGKISYTKGIKLPITDKIIPYAGVDTFQNNKERTSLLGLNFSPIPNSFIKAEYRTNTEHEIKDAFDFQVGYIF